MGNEKRKPTYKKLLEENKRLRGVVRGLKAALERAKEEIKELQRASKRQATPFKRRESNKKRER